MKVIDTVIPDLKIIEPEVYGDERGFFLETYSQKKYEEILGVDISFVQDNHSSSGGNVLRGLHFQEKRPQGKLVRVTRGSVFDVAVDVRIGSPTFGLWVGVLLSEKNKKQFWIPPGFAHGFQTLSERVDFEYKCTDYYYPDLEKTLLWNDSEIGVDWPNLDPILSAKDKLGQTLSDIRSSLLS